MAGQHSVGPPPCLNLIFVTDVFKAIHGDKQQNERDWVLNEFKTGKSPIMVATDVASRGIGMIDHNSSPFLSNMLSYLYLLPLTSCEHWCFSLLTVHACMHKFVQTLFGPYSRKISDLNCSLPWDLLGALTTYKYQRE